MNQVNPNQRESFLAFLLAIPGLNYLAVAVMDQLHVDFFNIISMLLSLLAIYVMPIALLACIVTSGVRSFRRPIYLFPFLINLGAVILIFQFFIAAAKPHYHGPGGF